MGSSLIRKVTPEQKANESKYTIMDPEDKSDISRANFRFIQQLTVTGHNQQQVIWLAQNIRNPRQKFLVKQIDKLTLYDNNRIPLALKQLQLWLGAYQQNNIASLFFGTLLFAFQDYQFLYMVYEHIEGFTLDTVLKQHVFNQQQTKYVVAVMVQVMEFFHERGYALAELAPQHFIVQKQTGKIKMLQIFNPLEIDQVYTYTIITNPSVYSSPEVLAKNKVLAESDYYTLGTMMYEMMTQKNVVAEELSHLQTIERHHIMAQEIQLKKQNLPQRWNPQAADFLVKLLIKNPLFRLGRYGSFQLRFHPWLQNYNWQILPTRSGISLTEPFFKKPQIKRFPNPQHIDTHEQFKTILRNQLFLKLFENYTYRRKLITKHQVQQSEQDIQSIKAKNSQKYYDEKVSGDSDEDDEEEEEGEYCDQLEGESQEAAGKIGRESEMGKGKQGRGLLNIVDKNV